jgi:hypothetical protein
MSCPKSYEWNNPNATTGPSKRCSGAGLAITSASLLAQTRDRTSATSSMPTTTTVRDADLILNSLRIHCRKWGATDAPVVILLPGHMMTARSWIKAARALADDFRIVALDLHGSGECA